MKLWDKIMYLSQNPSHKPINITSVITNDKSMFFAWKKIVGQSMKLQIRCYIGIISLEDMRNCFDCQKAYELTHSIEGLIISKHLDLGQKKQEISEELIKWDKINKIYVYAGAGLLNNHFAKKELVDTLTPAHQSTIHTSSNHKVSATTRLIFL